jgi:thioesterase domain-containing protein
MDYENWFNSVEEMAALLTYNRLLKSIDGPYAIAGFSFGGIVAFEIARQIKEQGRG